MTELEEWSKIIQGWREVLKAKRLFHDGCNELDGAMIYILELADAKKIELPNRDALYRMSKRLDRCIERLNEFPSGSSLGAPTTSEQPKGTTEDGTVQKHLI